MIIKIKHLGVITWFNGVDVQQTRNYIKMNNATYIKKIVQDKILPTVSQHTHPLLMNPDPAFNCSIEEATPLTDNERDKLERKYGFSYRQGIGEIIYTMVTCRPEISFPLITLS